MANRPGRWIALAVGVAIAGLVGVSAFLRFFPTQVTVVRLWIGEHVGLQPVIQAAEIHVEETGQPCPQGLRGLTVTTPDRSGQMVEPLVETEIGARGTTVYARYSGHWSESRSLFIAIDGQLARVDARIDTDYGNFVGSVIEETSKVYLKDQAICFDITVERMESVRSVEQWLGRIPLQGD